MQIWVDADACPKVIKEILFRAAGRTATQLTLVANSPLAIPPSRHIKVLTVGRGFDVADGAIVAAVSPGDLVITSDIPLAAEVLERGAAVLTPRGEVLSSDNIRERLRLRDLKETLRVSGIDSEGPSALTQAQRGLFAKELERFIRSGRQPGGV